MAIVKIELSDWLKNAGIVGFINIIEHNKMSESIVKYNKNSIEFDTENLNDFEELYFEYFIDKYKSFISIQKILDKEEWIRSIKEKQIEQKEFEDFNVLIKYIKDKLKSASYKSAYEIINDGYDILKKSTSLKEIKLKKKETLNDVIDDIHEQCTLILDFIEYLSKPEVKRIIAAKNVIYDVIQAFWSDVSFLNKNKNKDDMYECYRRDFVDSAVNYIEADLSKAKYGCFTCENKIQKLSKPFAYDITWITKMGVDGSRKSSHFWNYNVEANICPICNLIYSCIPAGFSMVSGKGIFINNNNSVRNLLSANVHVLNSNITLEELEEQSYFNIIDSMEQKNVEESNREIENIQIVKFDKYNGSRPYTFNVLSKDKLFIIKKHKKTLEYFLNKKVKLTKDYYLNIYTEVLDRLYNNKNLFDLIDVLTRMITNNEIYNPYMVYLLIKLNNDCMSMRGGSKVYHKDIDKFKNYGVSLKVKYGKEGENKIPGILYRLQNALKVKNQSRFMDTLLNAYTYKKANIPVDFVEALMDIEKFQTIGYAFLIGLQGVKVEDKDDNKEKEANK